MRVLDNYVDVILTVVALIIFAVMWRKKAVEQLRRVNNTAIALAVLLILMTIFAITQEIGDPADFGNELPSLLFGIVVLINRFV